MRQLRLDVDALCEEFWQWRLENFPEFASIVGFHKFDDRLNDLSLEGFQKRKLDAENFERKVESLIKLYEDCELKVDTDLTILGSQLKTFITGSKHRAHLCPLNRTDGAHLHFPQLLSHMQANTIDDYEKILCRLALLPKQLEQIIELLQEGIEVQHIMHRVSVIPVVSQLKSLTGESFDASPLAKCFQKRPNNITSEQWTHIVSDAARIITVKITPMFFKLLNYLAQQYIPRARSSIAVTTLPNGKSFYKACLLYHTSTNFLPEELHLLGQSETNRILQRMHEITNKLNFNSIAEMNDRVRRSNYCDGDELLLHYKEICNRIWMELPKLFNTLPRKNCLIKPIPVNQQHTSPFAYYKEGNDNRPGVFYVKLADAHKRCPHKAMALCLHEGIPGHHLQSDVLLQKKSCKNFRKFIEGGSYQMIPGRFPLYTSFMEGWGLYSEFLGEELGLYENLESLFCRLSSEMFRAVRLVIDTGIHAFDWPREKAIDYLMTYVDITYCQASCEIDRYITWPGQACSYKVGELKFHELRNKTQDLLQEKFDLREFHDVVLRHGAVPLSFLDETVDDYINKKLGKNIFE